MHLFTAESSVFVAVLCAASAAKEDWQAAKGNNVALKRGSSALFLQPATAPCDDDDEVADDCSRAEGNDDRLRGPGFRKRRSGNA